MSPTRLLPHRPAARRLMVWALLWALAWQGYAGTVLQLLGPEHRHVSGAAVVAARPGSELGGSIGARVAGWLVALRAWQDDLHARSHAAGLSFHTHAHGQFERHHHAIGDATVLALDSGGAAGEGLSEGAAAASAGLATMALGLACALTLPAPAAQPCAWPRARARSWQDAAVRLPERPPRA